MTKPIAITMGDPAGIGPELILRLAEHFPDDQFLVFGDARLFAAQREIAIVDELSAGLTHPFSVFDIACANSVNLGVHDHGNAPAVITAIENAVKAVQDGYARALLTAPISKAVLREGANFQYPGHTEFLAALDGGSMPVMMLTAQNFLSVIPLSIHVALKDVSGVIGPEALNEVVKIAAHDLEKYLHKKPRIWIAGLNPHAGENGHIGTEELDWIAPAIRSLRAQGYDVSGPYPADTMFHSGARENYDVAICMYHDQALIPIKTLAFDRGVNVTLGLSFLRTSPDHGTAFDIAGKNIANPQSMIEAYKLAKAWSQ